ncbi:uncharacterized protein LOC144582939 [Callithrix jacchus]
MELITLKRDKKGAGKPPPAPGPRQQWGTLARQFPSLQLPALPAGRAGAGTEERGAEGRRLPVKGGGRLASGFIVSFRPPPPAPRPQRHWKAALDARRLVIYSAGCARVTEPGQADWAADALGRGAESAGLRAGRLRQWASVCAAAAAAGGRGRGAGDSPAPLLFGRDPRKGSAFTSRVPHHPQTAPTYRKRGIYPAGGATLCSRGAGRTRRAQRGMR